MCPCGKCVTLTHTSVCSHSPGEGADLSSILRPPQALQLSKLTGRADERAQALGGEWRSTNTSLHCCSHLYQTHLHNTLTIKSCLAFIMSEIHKVLRGLDSFLFRSSPHFTWLMTGQTNVLPWPNLWSTCPLWGVSSPQQTCTHSVKAKTVNSCHVKSEGSPLSAYLKSNERIHHGVDQALLQAAVVVEDQQKKNDIWGRNSQSSDSHEYWLFYFSNVSICQFQTSWDV